MFVPVSAENEDYGRPYVNFILIALSILFFYLDHRYAGVMAHTGYFSAFTAADIPFGTRWITAITSIFLHDGYGQLVTNMLFLWVFGPSIEHVMGHVRYLGFFLLAGFCTHMIQSLAGAGYAGATGAVAAVLAAYMIYFPRTAMNVYMAGGFRSLSKEMRVAAYWLLPLHLLSQMGSGFSLWGCLGGYASGALLAVPFRDPAFMYKSEADKLFGADGAREHDIKPELVDDTLWTRPILKRPPLAEMRKKGREEAHRRKTRGNDWYKDKK